MPDIGGTPQKRQSRKNPTESGAASGRTKRQRLVDSARESDKSEGSARGQGGTPERDPQREAGSAAAHNAKRSAEHAHQQGDSETSASRSHLRHKGSAADVPGARSPGQVEPSDAPACSSPSVARLMERHSVSRSGLEIPGRQMAPTGARVDGERAAQRAEGQAESHALRGVRRPASVAGPIPPPQGEIAHLPTSESGDDVSERGPDVNLNEMSMWPVFLWLDALAMFGVLLLSALVLSFFQSLVTGALIYGVLYVLSLLVRKLFLAPSSLVTAQILTGSTLILYYFSSIHAPLHGADDPGAPSFHARLIQHLTLLPAETPVVRSVVDALEIIVCCDALVCAASCAVKTLSVQFMRPFFLRRSQAYFLELEESTASLYRQILPIRAWVEILSTWTGDSQLFPFIVLSYVLIKLKALFHLAKVIASAFSACFLRKLPYGTLLSEAREGEAECAICQQAVRKPVLVPCGHLFCDGCLRRWLESRHAPIDGTCPLCRSVVQPAHLRFSLDGSAWLLPHWF